MHEMEGYRLAIELLVYAHKFLEKPTCVYQVVYSLWRAWQHRVHDGLSVVQTLPPTCALCHLVYWWEHSPSWQCRRPVRSGTAKTPRRFQGRTPRGDALVFKKSIPLRAGKSPNVIDHIVRGITRKERRESIFSGACRNLNGVGDDKGGHFLLERYDVIDWDAELRGDEYDDESNVMLRTLVIQPKILA